MILFKFASDSDADAWRPIDDVVMGGRSSSLMEPSGSGTAVFHGMISLENGGGFASIRSPERVYDLTRFRGLRLRVRGDGKRYKLSLKTEPGFDAVLYQHSFVAPPEWRKVDLPFDGFVATYRGARVPNRTLERDSVRTIGLMISDRQQGEFRVEIESIEAYGSRE